MVLKIGDILELNIWASKYYITNITKTEITCMVYSIYTEPTIYTHDRKAFNSFGWKPAHIRWY